MGYFEDTYGSSLDSMELSLSQETDAMFDTGISTIEQETDDMFATEPVPLAGASGLTPVEPPTDDFQAAWDAEESPGVLDRPPSDPMVAEQLALEGVSQKESNEKREQPPMQIDDDKLRLVEGYETKAYVPQRADGSVFGNSGVTVAGGIDLGQQSQEGLRKMGVSEGMIKKFTPYLGVKKEDAVALLRDNPLVFETEQELADLEVMDSQVKKAYATKVAKRYNKDSKIDFEDLPSGVQTAIVSVNFQHGDKSYEYDFWEQMTSGDFMAGVQNLRTWGDGREYDYQDRRDQEAQWIIDSLRQVG